MKCWVCGCNAMKRLDKEYETEIQLTPESFKITDSHYGFTLPRYRCRDCGFIQCDLSDATTYYEQLIDEEYIDSSRQRSLQFNMLLNTVKPNISNKGSILDIGAGSGIFMLEAEKRGYSVTGIEPSMFLADKAKENGLNIIKGVFPDDCPDEKYDVIFLTDVIEHIVNPLDMLCALPNYLKADGKVIVTTPNVSSLLAILLGRNWWHYRIAHVGYYNKRTLSYIMHRAGFVPVKWKYAKWYFSYSYILDRLTQYFPFVKPLAKTASDAKMLPLNLFDSWLCVFRVGQ